MGSRKNNFAELALRFGSGLADPREQNHRNSVLFRGFCERGIGQRWTEGEMQKCEVIFSPSPKGRDFLKTCVILWYKKTLSLSIDQQRR